MEFNEFIAGMGINTDMFNVEKQLPRLRREVAESGKAEEVRALGLATAEALVKQRAAFLADVILRTEVVKADCVCHEDTHSLLQVARTNTAVAQARELLAKAELVVLQLAETPHEARLRRK